MWTRGCVKYASIASAQERRYAKYLSTDSDREKPEHESINDRVAMLGLNNDKLVEEHRDMLLSDEAVTKHFNIINYLRTGESIKQKLGELAGLTHEVKQVQSMLMKCNVLRKLEAVYNIDISKGVVNNNTEIVEFDDALYKLIVGLFKTKKKKPTTHSEVVQLYMGMAQHIDRSKVETVRNKQGADRGKTKYVVFVVVPNTYI